MHLRLILLFLTLIPLKCFSWHISSGLYKPLYDTQTKNGKMRTNPFSPTLGLGYNFQLNSTWGFSPQLMYIHHWEKSQDKYNKYTKRSYVLMYDFMWLPFDSYRDKLALRMGLSTFITKIKGQGGEVEVPNGSSTIISFRPDRTSTSYSATFNLGADLNLDILKEYFKNFGLRFETFIFRPLSGEYRSYAYSLSAVAYF